MPSAFSTDVNADTYVRRGPPRPAPALPSFTVGEIVAAAIDAVRAFVIEAQARRLRYRRARDVYDALRELDDRALRDLGFDRSELTSVAAEVAGEAECTRVRSLLTRHSAPV